MNEDSNTPGSDKKIKLTTTVLAKFTTFFDSFNFMAFSMLLFMGTILFSAAMYVYLPYVGFDFTSPADWAIMFGSGFMITLGAIYAAFKVSDSRVAVILVGNESRAVLTGGTLFFALVITLVLFRYFA